ncbi:hypothetical protein [Haloarcula sp. H-GB5]
MSDSETTSSQSDQPSDGESDNHSSETSEAKSGGKSKKRLFEKEMDVSLMTKGAQGYISFRRDYSIAPNSTVVDQYLRGYSAISFAYDENANDLWMVPLEVYDQDAEDEYKLPDELDGSFSITSRPIFNKVGLDFDASHRYNPEWDDDVEALCIDLDQEPDIYQHSNNDEDSE